MIAAFVFCLSCAALVAVLGAIYRRERPVTGAFIGAVIGFVTGLAFVQVLAFVWAVR